jgi:branched-chain amino acid transport system ATP-binding protein
MTTLLEVRALQKSFGSVIAASNIDLSVGDTEIVGMIGANGAGKTTFVNMVTGYLKPSSGSVAFLGRDITAWPPRDIVRAGIARSFQVPQVFGTATVFENLLIACGIAQGHRFPVWQKLHREGLLAEPEALMRRFGITAYQDQRAQFLPQGVRKILDIAMALVRAPKLLLLDEPTSGISVEEKFSVMDRIMEGLRHERVAVMFIEHDMDIVTRYAQRVLAFVEGTIIADGPPAEVLGDSEVQRRIVGMPTAQPVLAGVAP